MNLLTPEFRQALLWLLYHHQGGSSPIGQPIRRLLAIEPHDPLTPTEVESARSFRVPFKGEDISGARAIALVIDDPRPVRDTRGRFAERARRGTKSRGPG